MRTRTALAAAALVAAGALLGWLAASGRLAHSANAEENQGPAPARGGAGLSPVLPPPEASFHGTIGRTYKDSTPARSSRPPEGAPNVLVVLIDD